MDKKQLNIIGLNIIYLNSRGDTVDKKKEVNPDKEEFKSCIDAGYWRNPEPWIENSMWKNINK